MNATTATVAAAEMRTERMNLLIRASGGANGTPIIIAASGMCDARQGSDDAHYEIRPQVRRELPRGVSDARKDLARSSTATPRGP